MTTETLTCTKCGEDVHPLAVFPGGRCLECWRPIGEAEARTMTAEKLAAMWGAKHNGRCQATRNNLECKLAVGHTGEHKSLTDAYWTEEEEER